MNNDELLEKLWDAVMTRHERLKVPALKDYVWCSSLGRDDRKLYVNGKDTAVEVENGFELQPFNALLIWNGWPVASFDPFNGVVMGAPAEQWSEVLAAIANS